MSRHSACGSIAQEHVQLTPHVLCKFSQWYWFSLTLYIITFIHNNKLAVSAVSLLTMTNVEPEQKISYFSVLLALLSWSLRFLYRADENFLPFHVYRACSWKQPVILEIFPAHSLCSWWVIEIAIKSGSHKNANSWKIMEKQNETACVHAKKILTRPPPALKTVLANTIARASSAYLVSGASPSASYIKEQRE
jgi:hypothetical protein